MDADLRLEGLWELVVIENEDPESGKWLPWNTALQGWLLYDDDGHMAIHLLPKGFQDTELGIVNFPDSAGFEELLWQAQSYCYFARYTLAPDLSWVEHQRISHSNPSEWNDTVRRSIEFSGDTLFLVTTEREKGQIRVVWTKDTSVFSLE